MAFAGLRASRGDNDGLAEGLRGFEQGREAGGVNAVVVAEKEFHGREFTMEKMKDIERSELEKQWAAAMMSLATSLNLLPVILLPPQDIDKRRRKT